MNKTNIDISTTGLQGTILFCVLLVLKVTHVVDWSWWWITAPLWGPLVLFIGILLIIGIVALLVGCFK